MGAGTWVRRVIWGYNRRAYAVIRCVCNALASFSRNAVDRILGLGFNIHIYIHIASLRSSRPYQWRFWIRRETRYGTSRTRQAVPGFQALQCAVPTAEHSVLFSLLYLPPVSGGKSTALLNCAAQTRKVLYSAVPQALQ